MASDGRNSNGKYHARDKAGIASLLTFSDEELESWANDPNCIEQEQCAVYWGQRLKTRADSETSVQILRETSDAALLKKRTRMAADPFDPRTEISADARHVANK